MYVRSRARIIDLPGNGIHRLPLPAQCWATVGLLTPPPRPGSRASHRAPASSHLDVEAAHTGLGVSAIADLQGTAMTLCMAIFLKKAQSKCPVLGQEAWGWNTRSSSSLTHSPFLPEPPPASSLALLQGRPHLGSLLIFSGTGSPPPTGHGGSHPFSLRGSGAGRVGSVRSDTRCRSGLWLSSRAGSSASFF